MIDKTFSDRVPPFPSVRKELPMAKYVAKYLSADQSSQPSRIWALPMLAATAIIPELILHLATAQGSATLFNAGLFLPALFAMVPVLIAFAIVWIIPKKAVNVAILIVHSLFWLLLCGSQLVYYKIFNCFYSAYSMANGGEAFQFWNTILVSMVRNLHWLIAMLLPALFVCIFGFRLMPEGKPGKWIFAPFAAGIAIVLQVLVILLLPLGGKAAMSPYDLYHHTGDTYYSVNKLGLATAFRLDIQRLISGDSGGGTIQIQPPSTTAPAETTVPPTTQAEEPDDTTAPPETTEPVPTIDTSPNVLELDFEALIADAPNSKVKEVHQYFQSRLPSNKNEKTGLFEGCNLILITGEAFSNLIVDETRTPTLYKWMHEGYYFTNYYVPDWGTSTTDGEYAFLTGTVPKANVWSFSRSSDNAMPLTMAQQLIGLGYNAYAYHGHTYSYYDRNEYLENLGYTYRAYKQGLDVAYTWPESDIEVVDLSTEDFVGSEPFTAYYMTISGHREFNFYGNYIAKKNQELVKDEPYSEAVRAYIATQLELEFSLQLLQKRLEEAGVWENTVIVLTADHYPNGLTNEEISELLGHDVEGNFEIFKNGCIIYKPGMEPETIDAPCSHLDLLPTLSNLFGLEFDSRLYMGRDVFSEAEPLVMFRNRSWITDLASYNYASGKLTQLTDTPVDENYVDRINAELNNRFVVSTRILEQDYWRILFPEK